MSDQGSIGGIAAEALRQYIERIERLNEEKKALQSDVKDVFAQAKSHGFDTKIMREILKLRKLECEEREAAQSLIDLYMVALGMA
jgi:uncharacterized protein (UPF0335 family)